MIQTELFAKKEGMLIAASADRYHLERARKIAFMLGENASAVDIDMVRFHAENVGDPLPSGNYMGSIFKGNNWSFVDYCQATHSGSHGRTIKRWKLK